MKKLVIVTLLSLITIMNVNAQTVIKNNYNSTSTENSTEQTTSDMFGSYNFQYMSFDGFDNYGLSGHFIFPNRIGGEYCVRSSFEAHGNVNCDLGINYSFELTNKNDFSAYLILAAGPSLRIQDEFDGFDKRGDIKYDEGFFVDGFINPRLSIKYSHIFVSVGYFYWAPKFKFSKNDGAIGGLSLAIGCDL